MKVRIEDKIYDSNKIPIKLTISRKEILSILNRGLENKGIVFYPAGMPGDELDDWKLRKIEGDMK